MHACVARVSAQANWQRRDTHTHPRQRVVAAAAAAATQESCVTSPARHPAALGRPLASYIQGALQGRQVEATGGHSGHHLQMQLH
jgi:hypothetical protein